MKIKNLGQTNSIKCSTCGSKLFYVRHNKKVICSSEGCGTELNLNGIYGDDISAIITLLLDVKSSAGSRRKGAVHAGKIDDAITFLKSLVKNKERKSGQYPPGSEQLS